MLHNSIINRLMWVMLCAIVSISFSVEAQTQKPQTGTPESKINSFILQNVTTIGNKMRAEGLTKAQAASRFRGGNVFIDDSAKIYVTVVTQSNKKAMAKQDILTVGGFISNEAEDLYYCWIPVEMILTFASSENILFIGNPPISYAKTGSVTSAGDAQLFADKARDLFYTTGVGIKVGTISDGMQYRGNSQQSGDLPSSLGWVDNAHEYEGAEGTALMEIIYDLAPGAELWFGAIGKRIMPNGSVTYDVPVNMANRIYSLENTGCKVIVDDIGWLTGTSWFEDREITGAIESFAFRGGTYVSAAGNFAQKMWAGATAPGSFQQRKWVTFSGADTNLSLTVSNAKMVRIFLQWADPWASSNEDFDLYLFQDNGFYSSSTTRSGMGISPEEIIQLEAAPNTTLNFTRKIRVEWYNYIAQSPEHIKILVVVDGSNATATLGYTTQNYHIYGHSAAQSAISVAAYNASTPNAIEPFSSRGPSVIVTTGNYTFERNMPTITATDGVETKIGRDGNFINPFTGTSASAPHVAAIAALYLARYPSHTSSQFRTAITTSASTLGSIGQGGQWNATSGYGKIHSYNAMIKGLTTLNSPQVTMNTEWRLVRITGTASISSGVVVTMPANITSLVEGSIAFGNTNSRLRVEGTLIIGESATVNPDNVDIIGNGRVVGGNFISVRVDQLDEQLYSFGSIGRWQYGTFNKYSVPDTFIAVNNSLHTLRALQNYKPGTTQKYNNWNQSSNVLNHQTFQVTSSNRDLKAYFKASQAGISIKTELIDAPSLTGNTYIEFKDPWLVIPGDSRFYDSPYGYRNLGMSAPFIPESSGVFLDINSKYKGVFLDQGGT
ncbi:MAG: S8 family serine peptidase, partial [Bacteroidota bacterium]|nr:S8 family serine peptidase [Bacteroidota bacterium]